MGQKLPKAKDIKKGLFACGECGAKIPFDPAKSLRVGKCPKCGEQVLYPKIVSGLFLYSPLGSGGMGSVYKAVDLSGKKEYAVKLLSRNSKGDKDLINTLMREGEAGVSFGRHPNLIPVFAAGEDGEEYFIASEFVHGDRLDVLIESGGGMPENRVAEIALQILNAEVYICKCGYLYRDLKPENIMIKADGTAMLFDYGLCIPLDDAATCNNGNTLEGSPFYLPPERVVGAPEGEYSEIYSLGMVMFHMLSGHTYYSRSAFSADKVKSLLLKHVKSPRLSSVGVSLRNTSPEMINLLDRMLARFPNERYPDFLSLKMELERIYGPKEHDRLLRNIVYFEMVSIIIIVSTALLIIYIKKNPLFMSFFDALPF